MLTNDAGDILPQSYNTKINIEHIQTYKYTFAFTFSGASKVKTPY